MPTLPKQLRQQIPWYPTIDIDKCINCGVCLEFCKNGVYALNDISTEVANPFNCIVLCNKCEEKCEVGAISFPNKEDVLPLIKKARLVISECGCGGECGDNCDCKI